jgi:hypothetical protein
MERSAGPDDSVLPAMRAVALAVVGVLVPALVILWGLPSRTADLWAWTIHPDLTPIFMGAGYGAGAYFFVRVYRTRCWHEISVGVISAAAFALLMLATTLIHYDRFNHGHAPVLAAIAFYGWTIVYVVSPFLVSWLWLRNQSSDPGAPTAHERLVPPAIRRAAAGGGSTALVVAAAVLIAPSIAVDRWGWSLTPLTARVLGCFTAQVGCGFLLLSRDERWSSWRVLVQTFLIAVALLLVGAVRAWDDFDTQCFFTWAYLGGLAAAAVALVALYRAMERSGS